VEVTTRSVEKMLGPLYRRLGLAEGTLEGLTGVGARRFWPEAFTSADGAAQASRRLLARTEFTPADIGALVSTSVSKDFLEPPIASLVGGQLEVGLHCHNYDVGHACLGFLSGMLSVANRIELGQIDVGLVVASESSRKVTQATVRRLLQPGADFATFRDNLATLTLGSMGVAALLVNEERQTSGHQLLGGVSHAATQHSLLCLGTATEMTTDAPTLLKAGVELAHGTYEALHAELGLQRASREHVLHQVGKANHDALIGKLELPEERVLRLYDRYGNVGAAGVPFTLATAAEQGRLSAGEEVLLLGIGSGLNCTMLGIRW
jgi:3-oxoacyl-[acyl-carrier-protein] synthase-3